MSRHCLTGSSPATHSFPSTQTTNWVWQQRTFKQNKGTDSLSFVSRADHNSKDCDWDVITSGNKNQLYFYAISMAFLLLLKYNVSQWAVIQVDLWWSWVKRLKWCEGVLRGSWSSCQTICLSEHPDWSCRTQTGPHGPTVNQLGSGGVGGGGCGGVSRPDGVSLLAPPLCVSLELCRSV